MPIRFSQSQFLPKIFADRKKEYIMSTKEYTAGETIIAEGTYGTQTYLVHQGRVLICKETGGKKGRIPIAMVGEGEVFGEMYLFEDTGFRTASAIAQTTVTVEVITQEEINQHLANTPPVIHSIIRTLSTRLAQMSQENSLLKLREKETRPGRWLRKFLKP
jgi:CRP-like cAMP-binding protein